VDVEVDEVVRARNLGSLGHPMDGSDAIAGGLDGIVRRLIAPGSSCGQPERP
jgi:hypothetical protein